MTKHIFIFFAALCSLHIHANATPSDRDTVRSDGFCNHIEMLRPMQPSYLDGVVVPTRKSGNWFVSLSGGASEGHRHSSARRLVVKTFSGESSPHTRSVWASGSRRQSVPVSTTVD